MKELPPDPPVWVPPPEKWFLRHKAAPDTGMASVTKTLCAMWLALHDRLGLPLPKKMRVFTAAESEMFLRMLAKAGSASLMAEWFELCEKIEPDPDLDPVKTFVGLLSKGSKNG